MCGKNKDAAHQGNKIDLHKATRMIISVYKSMGLYIINRKNIVVVFIETSIYSCVIKS